MGVSARTLQYWEQGRRKLAGPANFLLWIALRFFIGKAGMGSARRAEKRSAFRQMQTHAMMLAYYRHRLPGGTCFFTVNLLERQSDLLTRHIALLRMTVRAVRCTHPLHIDAWVVGKPKESGAERRKALRFSALRALQGAEKTLEAWRFCYMLTGLSSQAGNPQK